MVVEKTAKGFGKTTFVKTGGGGGGGGGGLITTLSTEKTNRLKDDSNVQNCNGQVADK